MSRDKGLGCVVNAAGDPVPSARSTHSRLDTLGARGEVVLVKDIERGAIALDEFGDSDSPDFERSGVIPAHAGRPNPRMQGIRITGG